MMDEGYVPAKGGTLSVIAIHCLESDVFFTVVLCVIVTGVLDRVIIFPLPLRN